MLLVVEEEEEEGADVELDDFDVVDVERVDAAATVLAVELTVDEDDELLLPK